ncbi:MAG: PIN domain-containing protein [Gemmatimonadetes bacterium]|nr:PIN domain-containing protein [Gemmatimonadota bacterium]
MNTLVIDASVWVSAADATDSLSEVSRGFLSEVAAREFSIALPESAQLEIACALARRLRNAEQGRGLTERMLGSPLVTTHALSRTMLREAIHVATGSFLRSADAPYAALAGRLDADLVTWNEELIRRTPGLTPRDWMKRHQ